MRCVCTIVMLAALAATAVAGPVKKDYAAIYLFDEKVGHMVNLRTVIGNRVIHEERTFLSIEIHEPRRGRIGSRKPKPTYFRYNLQARYVETTRGEPLEFTYSIGYGGGGATVTRGVISNGVIELTETSLFDSAQTGTLEYPAGALMPEGARLAQQRQGLRPGTQYSLLLFNPTDQAAVPAEIVVGETVAVPLIGRTAKLTELTLTHRVRPKTVVRTGYVDDAFNVVRMQTLFHEHHLQTVTCDRQFAMSGNNTKLDLATSPTVPSPSPIAEPRKTRRMTFVLAPTSEGVPLHLPNTQEQQVTTNPDGTLAVRVIINGTATGTFPYAGNEPLTTRYVLPSLFVQSYEERIYKPARQVAEGITDTLVAARKIAAWTDAYLTHAQDGVGYKTALKAMASHAGDATERAVLTAAMCRCLGIPCRVVTGVVYKAESEAFVCHTWNQVLVGARWVSVDAALGADASRIALATGLGEAVTFIGAMHSVDTFKIVSVKAE